jgi:hypothetical protein
MSDMNRKARIEDVHDLAAGMPYVTVDYAAGGNPVYQVGRKSFVFFRNPRPDAIDPETGERYLDIIVFTSPDRKGKSCLPPLRSRPDLPELGGGVPPAGRSLGRTKLARVLGDSA